MTNFDEKGYACGVLNCGNGVCVHRFIDRKCPLCGSKLVEVVTTGVVFCTNDHINVCDYEEDKHNNPDQGDR